MRPTILQPSEQSSFATTTGIPILPTISAPKSPLQFQHSFNTSGGSSEPETLTETTSPANPESNFFNFNGANFETPQSPNGKNSGEIAMRLGNGNGTTDWTNNSLLPSVDDSSFDTTPRETDVKNISFIPSTELPSTELVAVMSSMTGTDKVAPDGSVLISQTTNASEAGTLPDDSTSATSTFPEVEKEEEREGSEWSTVRTEEVNYSG